MEIAKAAGISQAYLFRLFATKAELFLALVERCNARVLRTFADAAADARAAGAPVLPAMGMAYVGLSPIALLLNQLNAHAACDDPAIRDEVRRGFAQLVELVERESGAGPAAVRTSSLRACCSTCSPRCARMMSTSTGRRSCSRPRRTPTAAESFFCLVSE